MRLWSWVWAAAIAAVVPHLAAAEDCASIKDAGRRLACFDRAGQPATPAVAPRAAAAAKAPSAHSAEEIKAAVDEYLKQSATIASGVILHSYKSDAAIESSRWRFNEAIDAAQGRGELLGALKEHQRKFEHYLIVADAAGGGFNLPAPVRREQQEVDQAAQAVRVEVVALR